MPEGRRGEVILPADTSVTGVFCSREADHTPNCFQIHTRIKLQLGSQQLIPPHEEATFQTLEQQKWSVGNADEEMVHELNSTEILTSFHVINMYTWQNNQIFKLFMRNGNGEKLLNLIYVIYLEEIDLEKVQVSLSGLTNIHKLS